MSIIKAYIKQIKYNPVVVKKLPNGWYEFIDGYFQYQAEVHRYFEEKGHEPCINAIVINRNKVVRSIPVFRITDKKLRAQILERII